MKTISIHYADNSKLVLGRTERTPRQQLDTLRGGTKFEYDHIEIDNEKRDLKTARAFIREGI